MPSRLLILGGTADAATLARRVKTHFGEQLAVTTSLAGRLPATTTTPPGTGDVRIGGFGGAEGLAAYLRDHRIDVLVDATHPFAAAISAHAAEACTACGLPWIRLQRPPWPQQPGDSWLEVADAHAAARLLPPLASRVFLATGPGRVEAFSPLREIWFLIRAFAPPASPLPLAHYTLVVASPPFTHESEVALLRRHAIGALVTKQSGGPTDAKLVAARTLNIPVVMIARPQLAPAEEVTTADAAVAWLERQLR